MKIIFYFFLICFSQFTYAQRQKITEYKSRWIVILPYKQTALAKEEVVKVKTLQPNKIQFWSDKSVIKPEEEVVLYWDIQKKTAELTLEQGVSKELTIEILKCEKIGNVSLKPKKTMLYVLRMGDEIIASKEIIVR